MEITRYPLPGHFLCKKTWWNLMHWKYILLHYRMDHNVGKKWWLLLHHKVQVRQKGRQWCDLEREIVAGGLGGGDRWGCLTGRKCSERCMISLWSFMWKFYVIFDPHWLPFLTTPQLWIWSHLSCEANLVYRITIMLDEHGRMGRRVIVSPSLFPRSRENWDLK